MVMDRRYIMWGAAAAAAVAFLLFLAAVLTVPSEDDMRDKARQSAQEHLQSNVAWLATEVLDNDVYENDLVYNRYRIYFGKTAVVDCTGRFNSIRCRTKDPTYADYVGVMGIAAAKALAAGEHVLPFFGH